MERSNIDTAQRKAWLRRLAAACPDPGGEGRDAPPLQRRRLDLAAEEGLRLYEAFTDGELLDILRTRAAELGRSPAQREVFWAYRAYLKRRFGKWPYALERAGLSRSAGRCGPTLAEAEAEEGRYRDALAAVKAKAAELGRTPHPSDLPEVLPVLDRRARTWGEVLAAAGVGREEAVRPIPGLEPEVRALLDRVRTQADALGRSPLRTEVEPEALAALIRACGSWRNALYQVGLEPVVHIRPFGSSFLDRPQGAARRKHGAALYDCYYKVLHPDRRTLEELAALKRQADVLGRPPRKGEVDPAARKHLQAVCGTWSNALYQIGLHKASEPENP